MSPAVRRVAGLAPYPVDREKAVRPKDFDRGQALSPGTGFRESVCGPTPCPT